MLPPESIDALRILAMQITDPMTDFLLRDIAHRIAEAGKITSTAEYEIWKAQELGVSRQEIKKKLAKLFETSLDEIDELFEQAAEEGYHFDISKLPGIDGVKFDNNESLQQIVKAAVALAQDDFTNITQTIGMISPYGQRLPLYDAYNACCDFAFKQVFTGAADYNTAVQMACRNLYQRGLVTVDYESGAKASIETAVRRNIMGGLGLMQEKSANKITRSTARTAGKYQPTPQVLPTTNLYKASNTAMRTIRSSTIVSFAESAL